tara:strand:- start:239 stop:454 length:216 start_codon:yes stop_codon:yes gene_type:complete
MKNIKFENDEAVLTGIAFIWTVDDVLQECNWLTKEEALHVLYSIYYNHKRSIGINSEVIRSVAELAYPKND